MIGQDEKTLENLVADGAAWNLKLPAGDEVRIEFLHPTVHFVYACMFTALRRVMAHESGKIFRYRLMTFTVLYIFPCLIRVI